MSIHMFAEYNKLIDFLHKYEFSSENIQIILDNDSILECLVENFEREMETDRKPRVEIQDVSKCFDNNQKQDQDVYLVKFIGGDIDVQFYIFEKTK